MKELSLKEQKYVVGGILRAIRLVACTTLCIAIHLGADENQQGEVLRCVRTCMGED